MRGACTGLPPKSCSAYGDKYKLSSSSLDECVRCDAPLVAAIVLALLVSLDSLHGARLAPLPDAVGDGEPVDFAAASARNVNT